MFVIVYAAWIFIGIIEPSKTEWLSRGLQTATQSSTPLATQPANNALDVELNGASTYATTAAEPYAWWKIDLTEECIVTQIKLVRHTSKNGIDGAEIRIGNNNEASTANPLFAVIPVYAGRIPTIHDGDVALMGRYVTIQLQQDGASKQLSISDVHVFGYRTNRDTISSTGCKGPVSAGWAVRSRAGTDGAFNIIMVVTGKPFLCDGVVTEWRYWGSRSEAFRSIVFRRILGTVSNYEIVGINDIPAGASGEEEVYLIPMLERIRVLKGDVIGFAWGTSLLVYDGNTADGAMVRWYSGAPNGIKQGDLATFSGSDVRAYSLKAVVDSDKSTSVLTPKGLWPLNTEFAAKDLTGHKNHGVSTNALYPDEEITEGIKGFMSINGAGGSCVEIPTDIDLYLSEFTLLMYIRRRTSRSGRLPIMWFDAYDTSSLLAMDGGGHRIGFRIVTQSNTRQMDSGRYLSYGRWTLLAVTYKAATNLHPGIVSIWVDGHLAGAVSDPSFDRLRTGSVLKVGNCEGKTSFVGDIAWVQVYDKCLDEDGILKGQRIPKKGLAFAESVKVTSSRHTLNFQQLEKGCFHLDNSSAILESRSNVTRMKCAVECVALSDCVAWDWKIKYYTEIVRANVKTNYVRTCRLLKRTPIENEIIKSKDCVTYQLSRLSPVV